MYENKCARLRTEGGADYDGKWVRVCVCVCVCARARVCVRNVYVHEYMPTCAHIDICPCYTHVFVITVNSAL